MAVTIEETAERHTFVGWAKDDPAGTEFAEVRRTGEGLSASGVALGTDPEPYRLDYRLVTDADLATTELSLTVTGSGWSRTLELRRSASAGWQLTTAAEGECAFPPPGGDAEAIAEAVDPDVEVSPLFNTLPLLRHRLVDDGASVDLVMAWVSLPDLQVRPSRQRYTVMGAAPEGQVVQFDGLDDGFTAEIVFDDDGLVLDYAGIARRILTNADRR
ncbi:MAG: hypothetical protein GEV07_08860 [Streptosporangiales bacterium]|nr:hypothetical protein [Streptosporangiales bacterium]